MKELYLAAGIAYGTAFGCLVYPKLKKVKVKWFKKTLAFSEALFVLLVFISTIILAVWN
jgi:hypothetical protein